MTKRSTDLLDVFRHRPDPRRGSAKEGKGKGGRQKERRGLTDIEGVFLTPRHLLLLACVILLLIVLAFMVGLGVGRGGGEERVGGPGLQRTTSAGPPSGYWYVRGVVPVTTLVGGRPVEVQGIAADLRKADLAPLRFWVLPGKRGVYEIIVGPFQSRREGEWFLVDAQIPVAVQGRTQRQSLRNIRIQDWFPFLHTDARKDVHRR